MQTLPQPMITAFLALAALPTALFLSILVNRLVAYFVTPLFDWKKLDKRWIMYIAAVVGFILAWFAQINLLPTIFPNVVVGRIVTAFIIGGGANLIHDIIKSLKQAFGGTLFTGELSLEAGAVQTDEITVQPAAPAAAAPQGEPQ
jgi:hypothetical protein